MAGRVEFNKKTLLDGTYSETVAKDAGPIDKTPNGTGATNSAPEELTGGNKKLVDDVQTAITVAIEGAVNNDGREFTEGQVKDITKLLQAYATALHNDKVSVIPDYGSAWTKVNNIITIFDSMAADIITAISAAGLAAASAGLIINFSTFLVSSNVAGGAVAALSGGGITAVTNFASKGALEAAVLAPIRRKMRLMI